MQNQRYKQLTEDAWALGWSDQLQLVEYRRCLERKDTKQ
jgi:hypothetical protein